MLRWIGISFILLIPITLLRSKLELPEIPRVLHLDYTVYWAVPSQTNSDPSITAFGYRIKDPNNPPNYIAISRDLLEYFKPGDTLTLRGEKWIVADLMNKRWTRKIDFLVPVGIKERGKLRYEIP